MAALSPVPPVWTTRVVMAAGGVQVPGRVEAVAPSSSTRRSPRTAALSEGATTEVPGATEPDPVASTGAVVLTPRNTEAVTALANLPVKDTVTEPPAAVAVRRKSTTLALVAPVPEVNVATRV